MELLRDNANVFAWMPSDMPRILLEVITHKLNINPIFKLVREKKQSFTLERQNAVKEEIDKLLAADFI